jgi:hypothetical protein
VQVQVLRPELELVPVLDLELVPVLDLELVLLVKLSPTLEQNDAFELG